MSHWFLLLLHTVLGVRIWISGQFTLINRAGMDNLCASEFSGGSALVCTQTRNVAAYFDESAAVYTSSGGGTWNLPIASMGNVRNSLFTSANNMTNSIRDIDGFDVTENVTHSCNASGYFAGGGSSCGGFYDNPNGLSAMGPSTLKPAWATPITSQYSCGLPMRTYCIADSIFFTSSPTTRTPTTLVPTTRTPTTSAPTRVPSSPVPTIIPTPRPSATPTAPTAPTSAPSKAPTCSGCSVIIFPGNSSNTTVTLGPTPPVIITIPPTAVPNCSNCSILIIWTPTPSGPSGGTGVVTIEVLDNGVPRPNVTLDVPFTFFMPYSADLVGCPGAASTDCVWRAGTEWLNTGCTSQNMGTGTLCTCTHFTDFAVLLDESLPHPCQPPESWDVLYVFIAFYAILFVYCVLAMSRLFYSGEKQTLSLMLLQHCLIGAVCVLRILSCLNYLGTFGNALGLSAFVAAAPYPLEYLLFTKFASTWAGLVHYAMLSAEGRWKKIRPLFYAINVIGTALAVGLFVMFYVESSFESALAGTVVLALLYLALATAFSLYATKLVKELAKAQSSVSSGPSRGGWTLETKIRVIGHLAAACFVAQALCSVLAFALPAKQLVGWTATFCFFNVAALLCVLAVYSAAVLKAPVNVPINTDTSGRGGVQSLQ